MNDAWQQFGGTEHILWLSMIHARVRLYNNIPLRQVCLKLSNLLEGPGLMRANGCDANGVVHPVWLFPDSNGFYLDDKVLLKFFSDTPVWLSMTCWETEGNYLIQKLQKPSVEPK